MPGSIEAQLLAYPARVTDRLVYWAAAAPQRTFLAERDQLNRWRTITYAETLQQVREIGQRLLNQVRPGADVIVILSRNSIGHALQALGALHVGIPYAPLQSESLVNSIAPALVLYGEKSPAATRVTAAVDEAYAAITHGSLAKILFTSGTTGTPKGVINTHRMLTANQQMLRQAIPCLAERPPILCDWLGWHHTYGGNHNFGMALYNGGTLYIDAGKPSNAGWAVSAKNLEEVQPTAYLSVPKGLAFLLEHKPHFRTMFARTDFLFTAAAPLPCELAGNLQYHFADACGREIHLLEGYGATEMAPATLLDGLPLPGVEVKLRDYIGIPEAVVRGPNVTPGYWRHPDLTAQRFTADGFYRTGDQLALRDPATPEAGFRYVGRLGPNYKLSNGKWAHLE